MTYFGVWIKDFRAPNFKKIMSQSNAHSKILIYFGCNTLKQRCMSDKCPADGCWCSVSGLLPFMSKNLNKITPKTRKAKGWNRGVCRTNAPQMVAASFSGPTLTFLSAFHSTALHCCFEASWWELLRLLRIRPESSHTAPQQRNLTSVGPEPLAWDPFLIWNHMTWTRMEETLLAANF